MTKLVAITDGSGNQLSKQILRKVKITNSDQQVDKIYTNQIMILLNI